MNCTYRSFRHFLDMFLCKWKKIAYNPRIVPQYIHFLSNDIEADSQFNQSDYMEGRVKMMMKR